MKYNIIIKKERKKQTHKHNNHRAMGTKHLGKNRKEMEHRHEQ
jgi:hypothetical protein